MNKIKHLYTTFEKTVSNVKFAVVIISIFTIALVFGTFQESYHGADYANRIVYKSWWFITIEVLMFISIFMATVVRLPFKKRLYGFYTIHAGLIILFIGSFFTYVNGIDGTIQLLPNTPAHKVLINEDILRVDFTETNQVFKLPLPYTHKPTVLNKEIKEVKFLDYLPSAELKTMWKPHSKKERGQHSSSYQLFNENMSQDVTLSLSSESDFKSMLRLGLLNLHYMPAILAKCFEKETESGFILWHLGTGECFTAEERKLIVEKTEKGTRFVILRHQNEFLKFFPDFSPVAVNDDLTKNHNSPYRVLSKRIFEDKPNLFLFGTQISYFKKRKKKWIMEDISSNIAKLPWMGFKLRLIKHSEDTYPVEEPEFIKPIQESSEIVKGALKAIKIKFYNKNYWIRNDGPLELTNGNHKIRFQLIPKEVQLPYQITLEKFKMNTNPGTNDPASYESFVQLLDGRNDTGITKHHVFMNNPLKYDDFTFYQSSYFPIGENQYGSALSVNYDPGRFFKYLGSLLIVLGSMWHYYINRRKTKVKSE